MKRMIRFTTRSGEKQMVMDQFRSPMMPQRVDHDIQAQ